MNIFTRIILLTGLSLIGSLTIAQKKIDPLKFPNCYVVKLFMYKDGSTYHGTGILLDSKNVITNAHNIFNKDSVKVSAGYSKKNKSPFGSIMVHCKKDSTVFYSTEYLDSIKGKYHDFAVLKVDADSVFTRLQKASEGAKFELKNITLDSDKIYISGYPCFRFFEIWKPKGCHINYQNSTTKYSTTKDDLIEYKLNTRGGSSGSPLWIVRKNEYYLIGIHKSGKGFKNTGIFYNKQRIDLLNKWIAIGNQGK